MSDQAVTDGSQSVGNQPIVDPSGAVIRPAVRQPGRRGRPKTLQLVNGSNYRYKLPRWPRGNERLTGDAREFQRLLECAVVARGRKVDQYAASIIQSACTHYGRLGLYAKILRDRFTKMTVTEIALFMDKMGSSTDAKDACLKRLGLDARDVSDDPWSGLGKPETVVDLIPAAVDEAVTEPAAGASA